MDRWHCNEPLSYGGCAKGYTCIGHMNIYIVQQTCAIYADWQQLYYRLLIQRPYSIYNIYLQ